MGEGEGGEGAGGMPLSKFLHFRATQVGHEAISRLFEMPSV